MIRRLLLFAVLNFGALAIGGLFTGEGVPSDWYQNLDKAPWTPPGWVFGAAWSVIMMALTVFMAAAWPRVENRRLLLALFAIQWILNVMWNPLFFYLHWVDVALVDIALLTVVVGMIGLLFRGAMKGGAWLVSPYFIWLLIATSLNAYIAF